MLQKSLKLLLGLNCAAVLRGFRLGFSEFLKGYLAGLIAVDPRQKRLENRNQRELERIPVATLANILGTRKTTVLLTV